MGKCIGLVALWAVACTLGVSAEPMPASSTETSIGGHPRVSNQSTMRGLRICAAYDLHTLNLIEQHAALKEVEDDALSVAMQRALHARQVCRAGRTDEGVQIYESIGLKWAHIAALQ